MYDDDDDKRRQGYNFSFFVSSSGSACENKALLHMDYRSVLWLVNDSGRTYSEMVNYKNEPLYNVNACKLFHQRLYYYVRMGFLLKIMKLVVHQRDFFF